jgi:hypothetical protein
MMNNCILDTISVCIATYNGEKFRKRISRFYFEAIGSE